MEGHFPGDHKKTALGSINESGRILTNRSSGRSIRLANPSGQLIPRATQLVVAFLAAGLNGTDAATVVPFPGSD